jgi:CDP-glucose 4,6-dehydratase
VRPWQHVLEPVRGYLVLAQALCQSDGFAQGWNFGPAPTDERPVRWVVERVAELWPDRIHWTVEAPAASLESRVLKLDSSRARAYLDWSPRWTLDEALARTVDWFRAFEDGADMRRFTQQQIEDHEQGPAQVDRAARLEPRGPESEAREQVRLEAQDRA